MYRKKIETTLGLNWENSKNWTHLKENQNNLKIVDLIQLFFPPFSPEVILWTKKKLAFHSKQSIWIQYHTTLSLHGVLLNT